MDECISSRTRSNLPPVSINNWKICENNFKVPKRTPPKISHFKNYYKKDIISIINKEIDISTKKYESSIHELNFLQSGNIIIFYNKFQSPNDMKTELSNFPNENESEITKKYFIDDSDDSDPEYFDSEEIINRVNAERCILNRVQELKNQNLWSSKMINKRPDPVRPPFHWDLLIKEMMWFQNNISVSKQNKRADSRKLTVSLSKYVKEKETQIAKLSKEETIKAKKHCLNISRMIKEWWKKMQKIVSAKQKFRLDARRQEAINDHLGKVIETTQKYTEWLTEDLKVLTTGDNDTSTDDDPEFKVNGDMTDDEETIAEEEMVTRDDIEEEMEALKKQNQMTLEDILNELPADYFKTVIEVNNNETEFIEIHNRKKHSNRTRNKDLSTVNDEQQDETTEIESLNDNDVFTSGESSDDCDETMAEQEIFEENDKDRTHEEIDDLMNDAEVPIEELVKLYEKIHSTSASNDLIVKSEEANETDSDSNASDLVESSSHNDSTSWDDTDTSYESSVDLGVVFNIEKEEKVEESLEFKGQFQEISEVAMSTQPRGFTLESTEVKVQVPFLLKYGLREYQHVGLDWMAAIYEKRLNGILADEMGLGKTIQTIALLAYLSCEKGIWGPHLVVVPTSVVLNWEIEFKKWCPGFKILTYFGSLKERKEKRKGWTKTNAFHVCITSYKLAIQDCLAFKRKKWRYIILDEAQNIKNFKSQRWQTLLTFNSQRRLLLTGTPLQNNLMELWSLMHFLMPHIFQSHREFNEWFGSPLSGMVEGSTEYNDQLVMRLHKVLRPFILRRLKKDVEKQLPHKYEHLVMCPLSKRQRFLYDDFMSLTSTKEMLSSGQLMSIISILMQLRKVCNHPNLFEDRPTVSPFSMTCNPIECRYPRLILIDDVYDNCQTNGKWVLPAGTNGLADMTLNLPKFVSERISELAVKRNLIKDVDNIHVTDWVTKFSEKYSSSPPNSSFIPRDMIDYLNKSDTGEENLIKLPPHVVYGLKIKKSVDVKETSELPIEIINNRREERLGRLHSIGVRNDLRCSQYVSFGCDLVDTLSVNKDLVRSWDQMGVDIINKRTLEQMLTENIDFVNRVSFVTPAVLSSGVQINTCSRSLLNAKAQSEVYYEQAARSIPICLSRIRQNQLVQFPDTRLIEYDCGKLQILVTMLKKLKSEGHRCLIFTQMTRMLDVLEQFLSYHGYRYLRLDGTTKIEQRQIMMEQFNKDDRIFAFILSTRSGGVGVNLTGADTVIFYDSDWNPTMDAQAQDRCHRIGQTRDVHIYRLISRMTIEENILKKANEKRHLNEMAIEGGQFNMSYFKGNTLQDIFQTPTGLDVSVLEPEPIETVKTYKTMRGRTIRCKGDQSIFTSKPIIEHQERNESNVMDSSQFEAALEEVEDESDRLAAKITIAERKADLLEFDETVPWDDTDEGSLKVDNEENKFRLEMESQLEIFNSQLDPLQRYGVNWIEQSYENELCSQLELEETQIESNKQSWELDQIKALHENQEEINNIDEDDMLYIYGKYDPYAAQREELEKLRREEEQEQLNQLRKEEEQVQREREKAAAQAWAKEQHRNALKRRSDTVEDGDSSGNPANSEIGRRSPKIRKVVIPRMEFPDESITTVTTTNTTVIESALHTTPLIVSSQTDPNYTEPPRFPVKRKMGRPPWKHISRQADSDWRPRSMVHRKSRSINKLLEDYVTPSAIRSFGPARHTSELSPKSNSLSVGSKTPIQRKSFGEAGRAEKRLRRDISSNYDVPSHSTMTNHTSDFDEDVPQMLKANIIAQRPFPKARRMGHGQNSWKSVNRIKDDEYNGSMYVNRNRPQFRRLNRQLKTSLRESPHTEADAVSNRLSHSFSHNTAKNFGGVMTDDDISSVGRVSFQSSSNRVTKRNPSTQSPDENVAPYSCETHLSNRFNHQINASFKNYENISSKNGFPKSRNLDYSANLNDSLIDGNKKRRGRPPVNESRMHKNEMHTKETSLRQRTVSESTTSSAMLNKRNSFKIPVKTLNGVHKLFSAPLLLLKTKPVFVVTRKIEDNQGNVYTQNLTYPVESTDRFNAIAAKLSSFASSGVEK